MAIRLEDGSIKLKDGRVVYANSLIQGQDLIEILELLIPGYLPAPLWPFISGGGGGGGFTSSSGSGSGAPGPAGPAGPAGAAGAAGANGNQGNQGVQGPGVGAQGAQGSQGSGGTGPQGSIGVQGSIGPQGNTGAVGVQGPQGNQGVAGSGAQGAQGNQGLDGTGTQGLQGPQGNQGPEGVQGVQGPQGLQGPQGNQGVDGVQGVQGAQGAQNQDIGVSVTDTAAQSIPTGVTTTLTFDTEDWDTSAFHDNVVLNERLVVPAGLAGKYLVTLNVTFDANGTGSRIVAVHKNGVSSYITDSRDGTGSGFGTSVSISGIISLAVGDFITGIVHQNTGASLTVQASRRFQMQKVD